MHNMQIKRRLPGNANRSYYGTSAVVSFERRTFDSLQPGTTTLTHSLLQHRTPYQLGSNVERRMLYCVTIAQLVFFLRSFNGSNVRRGLVTDALLRISNNVAPQSVYPPTII